MTEAGGGGGAEPKPQSLLCLSGHSGSNDLGNHGYNDSQGSAARAMTTKTAK